MKGKKYVVGYDPLTNEEVYKSTSTNGGVIKKKNAYEYVLKTCDPEELIKDIK